MVEPQSDMLDLVHDNTNYSPQKYQLQPNHNNESTLQTEDIEYDYEPEVGREVDTIYVTAGKGDYIYDEPGDFEADAEHDASQQEAIDGDNEREDNGDGLDATTMDGNNIPDEDIVEQVEEYYDNADQSEDMVSTGLDPVNENKDSVAFANEALAEDGEEGVYTEEEEGQLPEGLEEYVETTEGDGEQQQQDGIEIEYHQRQNFDTNQDDLVTQYSADTYGGQDDSVELSYPTQDRMANSDSKSGAEGVDESLNNNEDIRPSGEGQSQEDESRYIGMDEDDGGSGEAQDYYTQDDESQVTTVPINSTENENYSAQEPFDEEVVEDVDGQTEGFAKAENMEYPTEFEEEAESVQEFRVGEDLPIESTAGVENSNVADVDVGGIISAPEESFIGDNPTTAISTVGVEVVVDAFVPVVDESMEKEEDGDHEKALASDSGDLGAEPAVENNSGWEEFREAETPRRFVLEYEGVVYWLFSKPPSVSDSSDVLFGNNPIDSENYVVNELTFFITEFKSVMQLSTDLTITFPQIDLEVVDNSEYINDCTLQNMYDLYMSHEQWKHATSTEWRLAPLRIVISHTNSRFVRRYNELMEILRQVNPSHSLLPYSAEAVATTDVETDQAMYGTVDSADDMQQPSEQVSDEPQYVEDANNANVSTIADNGSDTYVAQGSIEDISNEELYHEEEGEVFEDDLTGLNGEGEDQFNEEIRGEKRKVLSLSGPEQVFDGGQIAESSKRLRQE